MENKWLWIVLAIGLVLRLLTLNSALSFDEFIQTTAVLEHGSAGLDKGTEMNPLTTWTRIAVTSILGVHVWSLRLTSLIFAILTVWITFLLAKELYGRRTALWAAGLLALSAWHVLVSTSISFDGTFMTFYTLLAMYCFAKYERKQKNKWLIMCGIAAGLAILTKYTGVLVIPALMLYSFIKSRNVKTTAKQFLYVGIAVIAVYCIFPIIAFIFADPSYFWITLQHGTNYFGGREISIVALIIQYSLALLWMGPLLLFGYVLGTIKYEQKDWLLHSLAIVILAFYTFVVQDPFRPVERYFTILLPALCIMSAKYFSQISLTERRIKAFKIVFPVFLILSFIINFLPAKILPFYPKTNFINALLSLNWNFLVPFTGDQGPVGLYINFLIFALAWLVCTVCFVLALFQKRTMGIVLLGVGLALSVFVSAELALHPTSPDISSVVKETASFVKTEQLPEPFYTFRDYAMQYYLNADAENIDFSADANEIANKITQGGTITVIDFPALDKKSELWNAFQKCEQLKTFENKGIMIGYVFACEGSGDI